MLNMQATDSSEFVTHYESHEPPKLLTWLYPKLYFKSIQWFYPLCHISVKASLRRKSKCLGPAAPHARHCKNPNNFISKSISLSGFLSLLFHPKVKLCIKFMPIHFELLRNQSTENTILNRNGNINNILFYLVCFLVTPSEYTLEIRKVHMSIHRKGVKV